MNSGQGLTLSNTHFSENEVPSLLSFSLFWSHLFLFLPSLSSRFQANRQGGAVYSRAPTEIHNSLFEDNGAERYGGAVYVRDASALPSLFHAVRANGMCSCS